MDFSFFEHKRVSGCGRKQVMSGPLFQHLFGIEVDARQQAVHSSVAVLRTNQLVPW